MSENRPDSLGGAADVRLLLRQLGQAEGPTPRPAMVESEREARMAACVDAEVAKLQRDRLRVRRAGVWLAAAAAVLAVGYGARQLTKPSLGNVSIQQEPVSSSSVPAPVRQVAPRPAVPLRPVPLPSSAPLKPSIVASAATPSALAADPATASAPTPSAQPQSTLAEENRLFKAAAEAGRSGDVAGALARLDQLLVEHPRSPLAQTALVRKFRLLNGAGRREEARREAERYLASYPTGFAVTEAQALKSGRAPAPAPSQEPSGP